MVLLNRVAETLTGWTQDESRGRGYAEVFTLEQTSPHEDPVAHVLETGTVLTVVPPTLKAMDSAERLVSTSSVPIRDDEGKTIGAVLVSRDVSEQRKIAMDLSPDDELYANLTEVEDALTARYGSHASAAGDLEAWGPCQEAASIAALITDPVTFTTRGSNVLCTFEIEEPLWASEADVGQISQVIQTLVLNADQAMAGHSSSITSTRSGDSRRICWTSMGTTRNWSKRVRRR